MTLDLEVKKIKGHFFSFFTSRKGRFFVVYRGSFKDVHQVSIALGFHFVVGNEPKGCAVNAVPDTVGGFRVIFKDMAQMGVARTASYFNALHSMAVILDLHDGWFLDGFREGRPAATALVFIRR